MRQSVEIVPGQLCASVGERSIPAAGGEVPCWSYLSQGLAAHGQPEILFLLRRYPDEITAPEAPLRVFGALLPVVQRGQVALAGGYTGFGPSPFFASRGWAGWIYVPAPPSLGVAPGTLLALAVTRDELDVAIRFGASRIAARLGQATGHYPYPPWSEPRAPVAIRGEVEESVLARVFLIGGLDATVTREAERVVIVLPRAAQRTLADQLPNLGHDVCVAVAATPAPHTDGCLVWVPGQPAPQAIVAAGAAGRRLAAAFALLVPQQVDDDTVLVEDGVALTITDTTWARIRRALVAGEALSNPIGRSVLELVWV
jgi:hypothetical protein